MQQCNSVMVQRPFSVLLLSAMFVPCSPFSIVKCCHLPLDARALSVDIGAVPNCLYSNNLFIEPIYIQRFLYFNTPPFPSGVFSTTSDFISLCCVTFKICLLKLSILSLLILLVYHNLVYFSFINKSRAVFFLPLDFHTNAEQWCK